MSYEQNWIIRGLIRLWNSLEKLLKGTTSLEMSPKTNLKFPLSKKFGKEKTHFWALESLNGEI